MLQAIVQMYWQAPLVPKLATSLGPAILSQCGVKQGDPLSPLLFGLFIDEIEQWLKDQSPASGVELGSRMLQMLLYADDLVLLARCPKALQQQLDVLHEFCVAKGMEVNVNKTEIVVFRHPSIPSGADETWRWVYQDKEISRAPEFKYLGVVFHETKGVTVAVTSLTAAARRATWAMISRFRICRVRDVSLKLRMFKALVLPIMEYCGAIWGPDMLSACTNYHQLFDNPLQQIQNTFLRGLGQLRKSVSRTVLHREMCMDPVAKGWLRASLSLWDRLKAAPRDSLLGTAVRESIMRAQAAGARRNVSWAGRFMSMLEMISGKGSRDEKDAVKDFVSCCGYEATADHVWAVPRGIVWDAWDRMLQEPWEGLPTEPRTADTSKIRLTTYQNWFAVPQQIEGQKEKGYPEGMPGYIKHTSDIPFAQVIQLMRLRTGAHHLRVETERWKKPRLPRSQRVCEKCTWGGTVEDEFHLLFECPRYHHIRLKYERKGLSTTVTTCLRVARRHIALCSSL